MALPPRLRSAAAVLRAQCPPALPVRIRLEDLGDCWGDCSRGPRAFVIRLHRPSAVAYPGLMAWLLAHEWAEALSWGQPGGDHSDAFGIAYARCARALSLE